MLPCLSKTLFGIECLGCGFQRAFLLVLKGNFRAAFEMYPAIYSTLLFLGFAVIHFFYSNKNYNKWVLFLAVVNGLFMIGGYYYKHF
jgi:hypothetical protein